MKANIKKRHKNVQIQAWSPYFCLCWILRGRGTWCWRPTVSRSRLPSRRGGAGVRCCTPNPRRSRCVQTTCRAASMDRSRYWTACLTEPVRLWPLCEPWRWQGKGVAPCRLWAEAEFGSRLMGQQEREEHDECRRKLPVQTHAAPSLGWRISFSCEVCHSTSADDF